ncbi:MAG: hypothetical protein KAI40_03380 [Desulfobacterales bacterium]|nr:hypothetical protein [Desulfobacterales bacterium]
MADINTLLSLFGEAIAADAGITTWSTTNYGKDLLVMENCDSRNEPEDADCPLVIIFPMTKDAGLSQNVKAHGIGVSCYVADDTKPVSVAGVVRFQGGRFAEALRLLVLGVIIDNMPSNCHLESIHTAYDTIEQFPFVSANVQISITQPKTIGQDPYE